MIGTLTLQPQFSIQSFHSAIEFNWNECFSFSGESHNFWEAVYVISGTVEITEDCRVYQLNNGQMILHAPMEFHKISSADGTSPHVLVLSFETTGCLPQRLQEGVFCLNPKEQEEYVQLFHQILQLYPYYYPGPVRLEWMAYHLENEGFTERALTTGSTAVLSDSSEDPYAAQEAMERLSLFLIRLSRNHHAKESLSLTRDAVLYQKLVKTMNDHTHDNLGLEEIAALVPVSVSYMKVLFKRYAGVSPKAYYSHLRLFEAIQLLENGLSAEETSEKMNFSSPNYFSYFFKNMTGLPPVSYIKNINTTAKRNIS